VLASISSVPVKEYKMFRMHTILQLSQSHFWFQLEHSDGDNAWANKVGVRRGSGNLGAAATLFIWGLTENVLHCWPTQLAWSGQFKQQKGLVLTQPIPLSDPNLAYTENIMYNNGYEWDSGCNKCTSVWVSLMPLLWRLPSNATCGTHHLAASTVMPCLLLLTNQGVRIK